MSRRIGTGIYMTAIVTSVAGQEVVPNGVQFYAVDIMPEKDCTVIINEKFRLPLLANAGISTDRSDLLVHSIKFVESGINYVIGGKY